MGKFGRVYDEGRDDDTKKVELIFPVVAKSVWLHRPEHSEEKYVEGRKESLLGDEDYDVLFGAVVLKNICDEPYLRDEDEVELANDIRAMESPDRKAILDMWESLVGRIPKNLGQLFSNMSAEDFRRYRKKPKTTDSDTPES